MKKILITIGLSLLSVSMYAQASIKISKDAHDFGSIEEGTQASFTFEITNTGNQPLVISNVAPSCGCTTPEWTRDPIQPGEKGKIMATYNSQGRPGAFTKAITVTSNATEPSRVLTIKGFVETKGTSSKVYTPEEIALSPIASLDRKEYNFGKLESGQTIHQKIKLTNKGKTNLKFSGVKVGCYCVNYTALKPEAAPGETIEVELVYSPKNQGEQADIVTLSTNDIVTHPVAVTLQANVVKSLSGGNMMNQSGSSVPFK
jgi:hypothetical protein